MPRRQREPGARRIGMSNATETTRGRTHYEILANTTDTQCPWLARVTTANGRQYLCDYAPADPEPGMVNEDGSPTLENVIDAWKNDRGAFRHV
jgi:hypothetical protein